jgi:hypothetical protein
MTYADGWAAMNLEMPPRVPREEFDAESHWPLVKAVTGIDVNVGSDQATRQRARAAFVRAWNYDVCLTSLIGAQYLDAKRTYMGHAEYAAGGEDRDDRIECPFKTTEEVFAFDPWEVYGSHDKSELVRQFNAQYRANSAAYPGAVNMTGTYITLLTGMIYIFGWDLLLQAGGESPERFGAVVDRYAAWMQPFYEALAESETPVVYSHDDIVWASGPVFRPAWYRQYIFPNLKKLWMPLRESDKKVIFISDGNYTAFIDDIVGIGASGFFLEPLTDLRYLAERYGRTHFFIGNADTRILLTGTKEAIRGEVERCMAVAKSCPGFIMGVTNMIPINTPVENALYYNEVYQELSRR